MVRTRVRWPVVILVSLALSVGFLAGRASGGSPALNGPPVSTHVVRHGDTLWEIARATVGDVGDPRPMVDRIARTNGLDGGSLIPGTELVLPGTP